MEFLMKNFKIIFNFVAFIIAILFNASVTADYIIGQYYCYDYPYHHCVYYTRPTDATEIQHMSQPFFTQEPRPIYIIERPTTTYQFYRNMDPEGYED